jgi:hypothetical protein
LFVVGGFDGFDGFGGFGRAAIFHFCASTRRARCGRRTRSILVCWFVGLLF